MELPLWSEEVHLANGVLLLSRDLRLVDGATKIFYFLGRYSALLTTVNMFVEAIAALRNIADYLRTVWSPLILRRKFKNYVFVILAQHNVLPQQ